MYDSAPNDALPTPQQMRNYLAAAEAARQARRLREASRAFITGNIASCICLMGILLTFMHSDWASGFGPLVMVGLIYGYLAALVFLMRRLKRQRDESPVQVRDRLEAEAQQTLANNPIRAVLIVSSYIIVPILFSTAWSVAFRHMSDQQIFVVLSLWPIMTIGFFIYRFVAFRFWEDLLFAASIALAYLPFFLRAWHLLPLGLLSLPLAAIGTACLHLRWQNWVQSLAAQGEEDTAQEIQG